MSKEIRMQPVKGKFLGWPTDINPEDIMKKLLTPSDPAEVADSRTYQAIASITATIRAIDEINTGLLIETDGNLLGVRVTQEQLEQLAPWLHQSVALKGLATWDITTDEILKFELIFPEL